MALSGRDRTVVQGPLGNSGSAVDEVMTQHPHKGTTHIPDPAASDDTNAKWLFCHLQLGIRPGDVVPCPSNERVEGTGRNEGRAQGGHPNHRSHRLVHDCSRHESISRC